MWTSPFTDHPGNKCDLEQERQVQFDQACTLAKERGILAALETSAKVLIVHLNIRRGFHCFCSDMVISSSVCRRVKMLKKPFWWWPESCCFVTASVSSRGTWRATARLEFSSTPTLGQLTAQEPPSQRRRASHAADMLTWITASKDSRTKNSISALRKFLLKSILKNQLVLFHHFVDLRRISWCHVDRGANPGMFTPQWWRVWSVL